MKTFLMLMISLSISLSVLGQKEWADSSFTNTNEAINKTVRGLKEGKWIEYFEVKNGVVVRTDKKHAKAYSLTIYKADKPCGSRQFYMDGKIMTETVHRGKDDVFLRFYDENGKVISEAPSQMK